MRAADQLTVARILAAPLIVVLFLADFQGHDYWATAVFVAAMATDWLDGRLARRGGYGTDLGSLLDPIADKILVLTALIMLVDEGVFAGWMVAIIVAREFLVTGLRHAALERGVVLQARDLGKLKTWAQSTAVVLGGLAAGGAIDQSIAWWALLAAVLLTLLSGLDYARVAPRVLRGRPA